MDPEGLSRIVAELSSASRPTLVFINRGTPDGERPVAILSASFNPLTLGHTGMLEVAHDQLGFSEWLLMLSLANVDKKITGFSIEARLRFLHLWARERPRVSVALCSHGRFVDKLKAIREVRTTQSLIFLVGYDTLLRLFDPRYYNDMPSELEVLFSDCELVAMNRAEATIETIRRFKDAPEVADFAARIHVVELPEPYCQISSTSVRRKIRVGESVAHMVPEEIAPDLSIVPLHNE